MIKRVQLTSGAIEYVDTDPSIIKSGSKKTGKAVKKLISKVGKIFKVTK